MSLPLTAHSDNDTFDNVTLLMSLPLTWLPVTPQTSDLMKSQSDDTTAGDVNLRWGTGTESAKITPQGLENIPTNFCPNEKCDSHVQIFVSSDLFSSMTSLPGILPGNTRITISLDHSARLRERNSPSFVQIRFEIWVWGPNLCFGWHTFACYVTSGWGTGKWISVDHSPGSRQPAHQVSSKSVEKCGVYEWTNTDRHTHTKS